MKHITVQRTPKIKDKTKKRKTGKTNHGTFLNTSTYLYIGLAAFVVVLAVGFYFYDNSTDESSATIPSRPSNITNDRRVPRKRIDTQALAADLEKMQGSRELPMNADDVFSEQHMSDLLWGTYRSHLYYGMRTRTGADSLLLGMMWYEPSTSPFRIQLRHVAKSEDNIGIRWINHNGKDYGEQIINDTKIGIEITTSFIKVPGESGGDWALKVKGRPLGSDSDGKAPKRISLMFYVGIENQQHATIQLDSSSPPLHKPLPNTVTLSGKTPSTGDFSVAFLEHKKSNRGTYFSGVNIKEVWQVEKYLRLILPKGSRRAQLENIIHPDSNVYVLQRFKTAPFEMEISFLSQTKKRFESMNEILAAHSNIALKTFDERAIASRQSFENKFEQTFQLKARGFNSEYQQFAMTAFSNLMGGIGYFYGHNRIYINRPSQETQWGLSATAHGLYTATDRKSVV